MDYVENAKNFIHEFMPIFLNENINFDDIDEIDDTIEELLFNCCRGITHRRGSTRLVFIGKDFVVKFDYGGKAKFYGNSADEVLAYKFAKKNKMEKLFAEIIPYNFYNTSFFIMPRVDVAEELDDAPEFYETLSEEEDEFLEAYFAPDFHGGNYGYFNNRWVLIDYAWHNPFS